MKKTIMAIILGAIISIVSIGSAFAEFVYVTKSGKKYHHSESRFIKNKDAEKITVEEALERGLEPSKDYLRHKEEVSEEK